MKTFFVQKNGFSRLGLIILSALFLGLVFIIYTFLSISFDESFDQLDSERAFYSSQAGLEYAIREIKGGGYPIVEGKALGEGSFSTEIKYDEGLEDDKIISKGESNGITKTYQITYRPFGADCILIDNSNVRVEGANNNELSKIKLRKLCNDAVSLDKLVVSWTPADNSNFLKQVFIDGERVWLSRRGISSGTTVDIKDVKFSDAEDHFITKMSYLSDMRNIEVRLQLIMTDSSSKTIFLK